MFADTDAADAVPAARALTPIAAQAASRARWRGVELLTSGDPFLGSPEATARPAVGRVLVPWSSSIRSPVAVPCSRGGRCPDRHAPRADTRTSARTGARRAGHPSNG